MPVLVALRRNPEFGAKYRQLREVGKPAKVAIAALMRKLIVPANRKRPHPRWPEMDATFILTKTDTSTWRADDPVGGGGMRCVPRHRCRFSVGSFFVPTVHDSLHIEAHMGFRGQVFVHASSALPG
jgi:hypothetical protein